MALAKAKGWIDGHCHLADPRYRETLDEVLKTSLQAGVEAWVQGGVSPEDWDRQLLLKNDLGGDRVATSFGLHPWWVTRATEAELLQGLTLLEKRLSEASAAGELGIDLSERNG